MREPLPTRIDATPALPAEYHAGLDAALDELGLALEPPTRLVIDGHIRLLLAWTRSINLTAIRAPAAVAVAHVADSLSAIPVLRGRGIERFLDLGSGGGLPGIPLAAALPATDACLVEARAKKVRFLETVVSATRSSATIRVLAARAEVLAADPAQRGTWPAVTARAVASTAELVELAFPLLEPGGILLAWKRADLRLELAAAERAMAALGGGQLRSRPVHVSGLDGHVLIEIRRTGSVPQGYPREPRERRRRPW